MADERGRVHGRETGRDDVTLLLVRRDEVQQVQDRIDRVEDDETEYGPDDEDERLRLGEPEPERSRPTRQRRENSGRGNSRDVGRRTRRGGSEGRWAR